ncbi:MAG TPA: lysylphosphatidylglycerol synthase transmembrane domain-containing protein [Thermotogota bacterium]|mgnify:CR=1 FL=1|nr:lysylphosphatidylglycerol synthase transmembrane domain-containing protein [Thermotogota bacterium]
MNSATPVPPERRKARARWFFLSLVLGFFLVSLFFFLGDAQANFSALQHIRLGWVLFCGVFAFFAWLFESATLWCTARIMGMRSSFHTFFRITMLGQFYNSITPFASGGQPMQIYSLYRMGNSLELSTAAMIARFLVYQSTITFAGAGALWFFFRRFAQTSSSLALFSIIGFSINSGVILFLLFFSFSPRTTLFLLKATQKFLAWLPFTRKFAEKVPGFQSTLQGFHTSMKKLFSHPVLLAQAFLWNALQVFCFFSLSYGVYRAFQPPSHSFLEVFVFQWIVFLLSSFFPMPGATGMAEGGFYLFFQRFFPPVQLAGGVFIWRFFTYYLNMLVGVFFAFSFRKLRSTGNTPRNPG